MHPELFLRIAAAAATVPLLIIAGAFTLDMVDKTKTRATANTSTQRTGHALKHRTPIFVPTTKRSPTHSTD